MKIDIIRSGGIIGAPRPLGSADTATLPTEEARKLEAAVDAAGFSSLPEQVPALPRGADTFRYRITLTQEDGRQHTVTYVDDGREEGEPLRALIQHVAGTL